MVVFLGPTGAGKSVQAKLLAKRLNWPLLGIGAVLRQSGSQTDRQAMRRGHMLDDDQIISIISGRLNQFDSTANVILDGFPRTLKQAKWLLEQIQAGRLRLNAAIHLIISYDTAKSRLLSRARADDHEAAIRHRFNEYENSIEAIIKLFEANKLKVINIKAEDGIENIHAHIMRLIRPIIALKSP